MEFEAEAVARVIVVANILIETLCSFGIDTEPHAARDGLQAAVHRAHQDGRHAGYAIHGFDRVAKEDEDLGDLWEPVEYLLHVVEIARISI